MEGNLRHFATYLRQHEKGNTIASLLAFASAGIIVAYGVLGLFNALHTWILSGILWGPAFNPMMVDAVFSLIIILASLPSVLAGYLLLKSHFYGIILATILGLAQLSIFLLGRTGIVYVLVAGSLCFTATLFGFLGRRNVSAEKRDSPMVVEVVAKVAMRFCGLLSVSILLGMAIYIGARGVKWLSWSFLTNGSWNWDNAVRVASGLNYPLGGIRDFIIGSGLLVSFSELIAIPLGLGSAIFLAEYAPENVITRTIRFFIETLAGIPSVVIGLVGFGFFVLYLGMNRSLLAGALSLAIMILPWNVTVAEETMKAVPDSYREASYALGASKWQTTRRVVLSSATPGIMTGILLGLGGAIGETVVLLLTAGDYGMAVALPHTLALTGVAIPSLPVWIYGAYESLDSRYSTGQGNWEAQNITFAGAFVLLVIFLAISITSLIIRNHFLKKLAVQ
jgi:phosphate transport system permease protein